jgi:hypothetical protein
MRRGSRLLAIGLAAAALLVSFAWRSQAAQVQHATVGLGPDRVVELWRDPADGEVALRFRGGDDWTILRRRTLYGVIGGQVSNVTVYPAAVDAWRPIHIRYGLTSHQVDAALAGGDRVERPPLMAVPRLDRTTHAYLYARDFATNVLMLRSAARFPVPAPGPSLAGLRLADVQLTQSRGPGRLVERGYLARLVYSAAPDRLGTGERQLYVEGASPRSGAGDSYRRFFAASTVRPRRARLRRPADEPRPGGPALPRHLRDRVRQLAAARESAARDPEPDRPLVSRSR